MTARRSPAWAAPLAALVVVGVGIPAVVLVRRAGAGVGEPVLEVAGLVANPLNMEPPAEAIVDSSVAAGVGEPSGFGDPTPADDAIAVSSPAASRPRRGPTDVRLLEAWLRAQAPDEARRELDARLLACTDAGERSRLVAIDRRLRLLASPRALVARGPDVAALRDALGPEAIPEHGQLLADPDQPTAVHEACAEALGRAGDPRGGELLGATLLRAPSPAARAAAAKALAQGHGAEPRAASALAGALVDPEPRVRIAAGTALAVLGHTAAVVEALERETAPEVRRAHLAALGDRGDTAVLPTLLRDARAPGPCQEAALAALAAFAERIDARYPPDIDAALRDREQELCAQEATASELEGAARPLGAGSAPRPGPPERRGPTSRAGDLPAARR